MSYLLSNLKKKKLLSIALFISFIMISGCVPGVHSVGSSYKFPEKDNKKGLVVVSMSRPDDTYYSMFPFINVKNPEKIKMLLKGSNTDDFQEDGYEGDLKIIEFEEGSYKFIGWKLVYNEGNSQVHFMGRDVIPFQVKAGKITYLGEFRMLLHDPPKKGNKYSYRLLDSRKRDFKLFSKMMKNFSKKKIKVKLGKTKDYLNDDALEKVMSNTPHGL